MQRFYVIAGVVLALALLAVAIYFMFFRQTPPGIVADPGNPFGEAGDYGGSGELPPIGEVDPSAGEELAPGLVKITDGPVAYGAIALASPADVMVTTDEGTTTIPGGGTRTEVRYVERASGNVFSYSAGDRSLTRISNRTLPGIQEAVWTQDASRVFLRFLSEGESGDPHLETYALSLEDTSGGYFLEADLDQVLTAGSSTVVTLLPNSNGSIATIAGADGASPKTLFSSLLSSLQLLSSGGNFAAYTKASSQLEGYGFLVDRASGAFDRILGPYRGLTMLPSPTGAQVLYSFLSGNSARAELLDATTRETTALPIAALPEKCVWAPDERAIYCAVPRSLPAGWPDTWYQGSATFSDRIWKIDLEARVTVLIVDPVTVATTELDAVSLAIDPSEDVLVFTNKKDGSLWAYDL